MNGRWYASHLPIKIASIVYFSIGAEFDAVKMAKKMLQVKHHRWATVWDTLLVLSFITGSWIRMLNVVNGRIGSITCMYLRTYIFLRLPTLLHRQVSHVAYCTCMGTAFKSRRLQPDCFFLSSYSVFTQTLCWFSKNSLSNLCDGLICTRSGVPRQPAQGLCQTCICYLWPSAPMGWLT